MSTRVKICGLTRPEDIDGAVQSGADAWAWCSMSPAPGP